MKNLDYKGMNSTRVKLVLLAFFMACYFLVFGLIDAELWGQITLYSIIAYAMSETGNKFAEGMRDKKS